MYLAYRKVIIIFLLFIPSLFTFANEQCGVVNMPSNNEFVLDLLRIDNEKSYKRKSLNKILDGRYTINLSPGTHVLNIGIFDKEEYKRLWMKGRSVNYAKSMKVELVRLNIKENTHYTFALSEDNSTIRVNENQSACSVEKGGEIFGEKWEEYIDNEPLPRKEEAQLNSIMNRLANTFTSGSTMNKVANVLPLKIDQYFGTVIDNEYTRMDSLKVLSVLPYSLAAHYGLRSGDEIITLDNIDVYKKGIMPREAMNNYLLAAFENPKKKTKYINIAVRRNNKNIEIGGKFNPNLIPQSAYYIGDVPQHNKIINYQELPEKLNFEYERFLLTLKDYYQKKGITDKEIIVKRDRQRSKRIGFSGQEIIGQGLKVMSIEDNSVLKSIGVMKGDLLLYLNNDKKLIDQAGRFAKSLNRLAEKETFSLTVLRNSKAISLSGDFQANYTPSFALNIDMASIEKGLKLIKDEKFGDPANRRIKHQRIITRPIDRQAHPNDSRVGQVTTGSTTKK
jgi:C-terminal processing protease CtpA/Prc